VDAAVFVGSKTDRRSLLSTEDRGAVFVEAAQGRARLVVADGAGTAHLSGLLAELIVASFERGAPFEPGDNAGFQRWHEGVSAAWYDEAVDRTGSQWYARENLARGSAATFAAAVIDETGCWCVAVGDCCLFQIRPDPEPVCVAAFPFDSWTRFNSSPQLVNTDPGQPIVWPTWTRLDVRDGDTIVGTSDGIAEWVLAAAVHHPEIWGLLSGLDARTFDRVVRDERALGSMVDDDTVLARVTVGAGR
jgi:Protein phosphatase 2C